MSDWYQPYFVPPDALQVKTLIGIVPSGDHLQALVELSDPVTKVLIESWSIPHRPIHDLDHLVAWMTDRIIHAVNDAVEPF